MSLGVLQASSGSEIWEGSEGARDGGQGSQALESSGVWPAITGGEDEGSLGEAIGESFEEFPMPLGGVGERS